MLIWIVNDLSTYGLLSNQHVHRYKGFPLCGPEKCAEYSSILNKMIYLSGRRFLKGDHRFQRARAALTMLAWGTHQFEWMLVGGV
jgi:hypothetical protein